MWTCWRFVLDRTFRTNSCLFPQIMVKYSDFFSRFYAHTVICWGPHGAGNAVYTHTCNYKSVCNEVPRSCSRLHIPRSVHQAKVGSREIMRIPVIRGAIFYTHHVEFFRTPTGFLFGTCFHKLEITFGCACRTKHKRHTGPVSANKATTNYHYHVKNIDWLINWYLLIYRLLISISFVRSFDRSFVQQSIERLIRD